MADKHIDSPNVTWASRTFGKDAPHDAPIPSAKRAFASVYKDHFWGGLNKERVILPTMIGTVFGGLGLGMHFDSTDVNFETHVTSPAVEQSLKQGLYHGNDGYLPFDYDGTGYILVKSEGQYRLYQNSGNGFLFETDAEDAFFVLKNAGETLSDYAAAMANPDLDIPDMRIDLKQVQSLSERYDGSPRTTTVERAVTGWSDYVVPQGENIAAHFAQIGAALESAAHSSINSAYGMEEGFQVQPLETTIQEVEVVDEGLKLAGTSSLVIAGGAILFFPAIAMGRAIGAGFSAANAGRRKRKEKNKNKPKLRK
jgi:hypothetical protein